MKHFIFLKDVLWNHELKHIHSVCQDQHDLAYFALITKTDRDSYHYCHVFKCPTADVSTELVIHVGQVFDITYEQYCNKNIYLTRI